MFVLAPDITAEIVPNAQITGYAVLTRLVFHVGAPGIEPSDDATQAEPIGSEDPWLMFEQVVFHGRTRILHDLMLHVPETNLENGGSLVHLSETPVIEGLLKIHAKSSWAAEAATVRWIDPQANRLVCMFAGYSSSDKVDLRLRIAEDVFLLFVNNQWAGWALDHPAAHIVDDGHVEFETLGIISNPLPSAELRTLLVQYYELVKYPFEAFDKKMPEEFRRLQALYKKSKKVSDPLDRQKIIEAWIVDVTETFYYITLNELNIPLK